MRRAGRLSRWQARRLRRGVLRRRLTVVDRMAVWDRLASHYACHDPRAARALASLVARDPEPAGSELPPNDPLRQSASADAAWNLVLPPDWAAPGLVAALIGTGRPARTDPARTLSMLALGRDAVPPGQTMWTAAHELVAEATRHGGHPLGEAARSYVLTRADPALTDRVCRLALDDPAPREPNLGWWCRRHRLSPSDPLRRAEFHLRLGDLDSYRDADPDGTLLAAIYRAADPDGRFQLRQTLIGAGAFDLLRTLPGARDPFRLDVHQQAGHEQTVDLLVEAEDWPRLWGYALDAPLDTAIAVSHRITGWEPADPNAAGLFRRLRDADPHLAHRTRVSLSRHRPYQFTQSHVIDQTESLSIAPDGSKLVLAGDRIGLIEVRTGDRSPAVLHPVRDDRVLDVIHLGESIVTVQGSPDGPRNGRPGYRLVRYVPGRRPRVLRTSEHPSRLLRTPTGFVTLLTPDLFVFGTAADEDGLRIVPLPEQRNRAYSSDYFLRASDADTGRVLVCLPHPHRQSHHVVLVLDAAGDVVARSAPDNRTEVREAVFVGADRIVSDGLTSWRIADGTLTPQHSTNRYSRVYPNAGSLFPVAIHGVVGYLEISEMRFADASSLDPVADPFTDPDTYAALYFNRQADDSLRPPSAGHSEYRSGRGSSSPRQTFHQGDGRIAWRTHPGIPVDGPIAPAPQRTVTAYEPVFNVVGAIAGRGPGAYADRATLAHARGLVPARSDIADLIDLLQARLEHRYATEVALGTASGAPPAMSDDISIGRPTGDDPR